MIALGSELVNMSPRLAEGNSDWRVKPSSRLSVTLSCMYRKDNGKFSNADKIVQVSGIGAAIVEKIKPIS